MFLIRFSLSLKISGSPQKGIPLDFASRCEINALVDWVLICLFVCLFVCLLVCLFCLLVVWLVVDVVVVVLIVVVVLHLRSRRFWGFIACRCVLASLGKVIHQRPAARSWWKIPMVTGPEGPGNEWEI